MRIREGLLNAPPDVLDGDRLEAAGHFLGRQIIALREGVNLGVDALLLHLAVGPASAVVVARGVQRHGQVAGQVRQHPGVDEALGPHGRIVRRLAVIAEGAAKALVVLQNGVGQHSRLFRILLEFGEQGDGFPAVGGEVVALVVFQVDEVVGAFGGAQVRGFWVFPAVGVAGQVGQLLAGFAEEGRHVVREAGDGRIGDDPVADHPPAAGQAGQDQDGDGGRSEAKDVFHGVALLRWEEKLYRPCKVSGGEGESK